MLSDYPREENLVGAEQEALYHPSTAGYSLKTKSVKVIPSSYKGIKRGFVPSDKSVCNMFLNIVV